MGKGSLHTINGDVIVAGSILDVHVGAGAAIARSKMKQDDDISITVGKKLLIWDSTGTKRGEIYQTAFNFTFDSVHNGLNFRPKDGSTKFLYPAVNCYVNIYGSSGTNFIQITHDNTDGEISTNAGLLKLNPASDIYALQDLIVRSGKQLWVNDSTNTKTIKVYHNSSNGFVESTVGAIFIQPADNNVYIRNTGSDAVLHILASNSANKLVLTHNDTDGSIQSTTGKLILNPATSVDFNNKPAIGLNDITYNAAVTRYFSVHPGDFVPADNNTLYSISGGGVIAGGVVSTKELWAGIHLPEGAIVTSFLVSWFRDDAAASGGATLYRTNNVGSSDVMATADSNSSAGNHEVEDTTIGNATINNQTYSYSIYLTLTPNDSVLDVKLFKAKITYTILKPLP